MHKQHLEIDLKCYLCVHNRLVGQILSAKDLHSLQSTTTNTVACYTHNVKTGGMLQVKERKASQYSKQHSPDNIHQTTFTRQFITFHLVCFSFYDMSMQKEQYDRFCCCQKLQLKLVVNQANIFSRQFMTLDWSCVSFHGTLRSHHV